ncbi:MAG TPA: acyl-ACP--UDP-N-acetylglucosamine O-acyltransferase [Tepidisphaeraceae bacterium]|nr:acyl-ACP--UDP-N-acetylglucosamine O-acyltransferase [Tepidisphaeraceae bacterium]
MPEISPLASVDPRAELADDVVVGPFCVVGPHVRLGAGCVLQNSVTLTGHTTAGERNVFFPNAVIGAPPQDKRYRGEPVQLQIGDDNVFREHVTVHCGTVAGGGVTRLGSDNLLMVGGHVGHDVRLGSHCVLSNNFMLAGHVVLRDRVNLGGGVGVRHFVTIGEFGFVTAMTRVTQDVPPFCIVDGPNVIRGLNKVGLKRGGFDGADIDALDDAAKRLFYYRTKPFALALAEFDTLDGLNPHVRHMVEFLRRRNEGKQGRYLENHRNGTH